jgi:acetyltransferase
VPHYILPESMASACAAAYRFGRSRAITRAPVPRFDDVDADAARAVLAEAKRAGRRHLPEVEAIRVLEAYRLPTLPSDVATSAAEAGAIAAKIGFPVAMKVYSPQVVHKFDVGGVALNVGDAGEAARAYERIVASVAAAAPDAEVRGVNVQRMAPGGREVILGLTRDNVFGHVLMFGLGGTFVEVFRDVSFRTTPLDDHAVRSMITEIRSYPILAGARGRRPADLAAVEECIGRLGQLADECPDIEELDMNPVIVGEEGKGAFVADARILV